MLPSPGKWLLPPSSSTLCPVTLSPPALPSLPPLLLPARLIPISQPSQVFAIQQILSWPLLRAGDYRATSNSTAERHSRSGLQRRGRGGAGPLGCLLQGRVSSRHQGQNSDSGSVKLTRGKPPRPSPLAGLRTLLALWHWPGVPSLPSPSWLNSTCFLRGVRPGCTASILLGSHPRWPRNQQGHHPFPPPPSLSPATPAPPGQGLCVSSTALHIRNLWAALVVTRGKGILFSLLSGAPSPPRPHLRA